MCRRPVKKFEKDVEDRQIQIYIIQRENKRGGRERRRQEEGYDLKELRDREGKKGLRFEEIRQQEGENECLILEITKMREIVT